MNWKQKQKENVLKNRNLKRFFLFNAESLYFSEIARELYDILIGTKWSELPDDLMKTLRHKRVIIPNDEEYIY